MGGHGFSYYSGLPGIISELGPTPTYEGKYKDIQDKTRFYICRLQGFWSNL